jgi:hypothetical protein
MFPIISLGIKLLYNFAFTIFRKSVANLLVEGEEKIP